VVGERLDLSAFEGKPITLELLEKATAQLMKEIASLAGELRGEKPPVTLHDGLGEKIKR
jgi:hypothetical protein